MDLNLDSSLTGINGDMESLGSLLQCETVGGKWFQFDKPAGEKSNCFRVLQQGLGIHQQDFSSGLDEVMGITDLIVVHILELKINLMDSAVAEWLLTKIVLATDYSWWK